MNSVRVLDPALSDPFESVFCRFLAPMRLDKSMNDIDIRIDVVEQDDAYKVKADLPGVKKEDITVQIEGNRAEGAVP